MCQVFALISFILAFDKFSFLGFVGLFKMNDGQPLCVIYSISFNFVFGEPALVLRWGFVFYYYLFSHISFIALNYLLNLYCQILIGKSLILVLFNFSFCFIVCKLKTLTIT